MRSAVTPSILRRREARTYFDAGPAIMPGLGQCASVSARHVRAPACQVKAGRQYRMCVLVTQQWFAKYAM
jgi:hypothetical protein